jgi:hypothetical protein
VVSATEAASAKDELAAGLAQGVATLSLNDTVVFTQYVRLVLPLDGYVFWVKSDLVSDSALLNVMGMNTTLFGSPQYEAAQPKTLTVTGCSLHYATRQDNNEDETVGVSTVILTSPEPIQMFNDVQPNTMWVGNYAGDREGDDGPITFAFSQRGRYYKAADLFHYSGTAVIPAFRTQLVDSVESLSQRQLIVSNSLPIWISLNNYFPPYPGFNNTLPLFPSFLVPDNYPPAYGAVHIDPVRTIALQSAPAFDATLGSSQLAEDFVRVTLYGLTNDAAQSFLAAVEQFSYDTCAIGLMNMPVVRDGKRVSPELNVLAMQKFIDFEVSYTQAAARDVARQMIEKTIIGYQVKPLNAIENYGLERYPEDYNYPN